MMKESGAAALNVVDLFCGGGGFTHGAIEAGAVVRLAIDSCPEAVKVHRLNHPETPCLQIELGGNIEETASLIRFYLDKDAHLHLHASPPCQALSNCSNQPQADGVQLVDWFLELVAYMKPNSWSLENVLPLGKWLDERGVNYARINSANYGVAQERKRIFAGEGWIAKESHNKAQWQTVREALPHLTGHHLRERINPNIRERTLDEPLRTITSMTVGQVRLLSSVGVVRSFSLNEMAALQGWPGMDLPIRDFGTIEGDHISKRAAWRIIGNMVCPPVAKAIIEGIQ